MAKKRDVYRCSVCGAQALKWLGQCPKCGEWNVMEPYVEATPRRSAQADSRDGALVLANVSDDLARPFSSGIEAIDRVLGGGIQPGSSILIGGEPGIGKSTLLLQLCGNLAARGVKTLYASGEEGLPQIRARAERLGALHPALLGISTSSVEDICAVIERERPLFAVADSAQTLACAEAEGLPGNVAQTRAVATLLVETCRKCGCALALVGHVTKDGSLAGPRLLEHMVDTVISLEGDRRQIFRLLRVFKNRFGPNDELLVFRMEQRGLAVVDDPSTFFLEARDPGLSGTALVMGCEGNRPLAVEVQALVSRTFLSIPRRAALGFDVNRLHLILAVLEKRLRLNFGQVDIYAKVGGGIRIQEPGLDLGIAAAALSSYYDQPLPEKAIFWGELDLNGQIRPVAAQKSRWEQAKRLGFTPIASPGAGGAAKIASVMDLQKTLFGRGK